MDTTLDERLGVLRDTAHGLSVIPPVEQRATQAETPFAALVYGAARYANAAG